MTVSEHLVKVSSRIPFPKALVLGQDVEIIIDTHRVIGNVVKTEDLDQQDGTIKRVYTIKFLSE